MASTAGATGCVILYCTCRHKYQDEKYGENQRVYNLCGGKNAGKANCSVCGNNKGAA